MGTGNVLPAFFRENLKRHPEMFDQSEEAVTKGVNAGIKQAQAVHAINDAKKRASVTREDRRREFLAQRKEFVRLREIVNGLEVRINCKAATIREWEKQTNNLIARKKVATAEMRLGDERGLENQIRVLEDDLDAAKRDLDKLRTEHRKAIGHFRDFDRETLRSLAEELGEELGNVDKV
jgi:phage shock protein A